MEGLKERLEGAVFALMRIQERYDPSGDNYYRLAGKIQGVKLALSYLEEEERRDGIAYLESEAGGPITEEGGEVVHVGGGVNAEDCPACEASPTELPYPWVCPG